MNRVLETIVAGAAAIVFSLAPAQAETKWPERPVRILIPFSAGGAADTLARILGDHFPSEAKGQPLIIENKSGAGGTLAGGEAARSRPDGYTLLIGDIGANAVAGALYTKLPYDVSTSFTPVIHLANLPMAVIVHPSLAEGGLEGFLKRARSKPGALSFASAGAGGASHLMMVLLNLLAKTEMVHVPYRGGGPVVQAVMTNETQIAISTVSTCRPFIEDGVVKALAVGEPKSIQALPNIPPGAAVLPGFEAVTWHGIHVPAGTPKEIVLEINRIFNALLKKPEVLKRLEQQTAVPVGGTPEQYARFVDGEIVKWVEVVKRAGIQMN